MDHYARCLIANGRFSEACLIYEKYLDADSLQINESYNYAIAKWADRREVERTIFEGVVKNEFDERGANLYQCLSMASYLLGDKDHAMAFVAKARQELLNVPVELYSGWRYCNVTISEFQQDLDQLEQMIKGQDVLPAFLREPSLSFTFA